LPNARSISSRGPGRNRRRLLPSRDGIALDGWLFTPPDPNGSAVILLHGVGDTRSGMAVHAGYLLQAGFTVRTPDVVESAVSPQVGQAVLAFARSYSSSGPNSVTCEALAFERNGSPIFPARQELRGDIRRSDGPDAQFARPRLQPHFEVV
jgi:hypothetical protein